MEKTIKHYIKYKFDESPYIYDGEENESRDAAYIVKKYGMDEISTKIAMGGRPDCFSIIAFGFYDRYFINDENILYYTNKLNSTWIYFGDRIDLSEYNEKEHIIVGNKEDTVSFCLIGNYLYPLGPNDITYNEFIEEYYNDLERLNIKILK